ncbi:MAG: DUF4982 domain-containing protein [Bacteroidales bacterium]|nr:DUF4982 domain-containing protein [Bacteroidales bacterium]
MNRKLIVLLLLLLPSACFAQRLVENACDGWSFSYVAKPKKPVKGLPACTRADFDASSWKQVSVPHTWQTYETTGELHPYIASPHARDNEYWWTGTGFYRKTFRLSGAMEGRRLFMEFDGVMKYCKGYLNGHIVGEHFGGYGPFCFDLTSYVIPDGENVFVLEVGNDQNDPHNIPPMDAGCWNFYGGIYREARFVSTPEIYIPFQGSSAHEGGTHITTRSINSSSEVRMRTWVRNDSEIDRTVHLRTEIIDKNGSLACAMDGQAFVRHGEYYMFDQNGIVHNPFKWSPDHPDQYLAVSKLSWAGSQATDQYESRFGIREFYWNHEEQRLYVNGEAVNIHGFNRHQEYPWLGDAIPYFIHRMDLFDIKYNLGCNALRPGQYCSGPEVFALADSLGLITFAELPNVKNRNFSPEMQRIQAVEMVRKLRNNPSVLLFDMGDETDRAADSKWVHDESPDHYITCRHCEGTGGAYISITPQELRMSKMLRCSVRGWYSDDENPLRQKNQQWTSNDEFRHEVALEGKKPGSNEDRIDQPNLMVWLYEDHGCDREYHDAPMFHYNPKGWVDSYRVPKYSYYLWQANYAREPMAFVMPHFWRRRYIGQKKDFVVDSNCEEVRLLAGKKNCGTLRPNADNRHSVTFRKVPVTDGDLVLTGYNGGKEVVRKVVKMAGAPAKLSITSSHDVMEASRGSVFIVTADILDKAGVSVLGANNTLRWSVSGPATLVGAAEYVSQRDDHEVLRGTLYIDTPVSNVIRSTGTPGIIKVKVEADGLKGAEIEIKAKPKPENKCITY